MPMTTELPREAAFIATRAHGRFVEFADACAEYRYIGVCHGRPGVGKTRSACEYAAWPGLPEYAFGAPKAAAQAEAVRHCRGLFHTATVANTPKTLQAALGPALLRLGHARLVLDGRLDEGECMRQAHRACPLVIVDEADRLSLKSLEHLRDLYDHKGFGLILLGMPGLEKRLARYPQLYSRIGFVHEFKPLGPPRKPASSWSATARRSASPSTPAASSTSRPWQPSSGSPPATSASSSACSPRCAASWPLTTSTTSPPRSSRPPATASSSDQEPDTQTQQNPAK